MVYGIVKKLGGEIQVQSEPGKGATFQVFLPLIAKTTEPAPAETVEIVPAGTERILVVDDEHAIAQLEKKCWSASATPSA